MIFPEGVIQTYKGIMIQPLNPKVEHIDIEDIAHALGNMCRYAGHVNEFYSVAEHCVLASYLAPKDEQLEALLHDATEAYLVDVPRPVKYLMPDYRVYEARLQEVIDEKFNLKPHSKALKEIDSRLLVSESYLLFAVGIDIPGVERYDSFELFNLSPKYAKRAFLDRFDELTGNTASRGVI